MIKYIVGIVYTKVYYVCTRTSTVYMNEADNLDSYFFSDTV